MYLLIKIIYKQISKLQTNSNLKQIKHITVMVPYCIQKVTWIQEHLAQIVYEIKHLHAVEQSYVLPG